MINTLFGKILDRLNIIDQKLDNLDILLDYARRSYEKETGMYNKKDIWYPALGPDACAPGKNLLSEWVFVKIRALDKHGDPCGVILREPHIAELRPGGWVSQEGSFYETPEFPYQVVYWRPIPGGYLVNI